MPRVVGAHQEKASPWALSTGTEFRLILHSWFQFTHVQFFLNRNQSSSQHNGFRRSCNYQCGISLCFQFQSTCLMSQDGKPSLERPWSFGRDQVKILRAKLALCGPCRGKAGWCPELRYPREPWRKVKDCRSHSKDGAKPSGNAYFQDQFVQNNHMSLGKPHFALMISSACCFCDR